ncbi:frizzled-10-like [Sycon ciliatum]|uniref:frizzled-10-like n=1 Tax=Sycon ciliatum TaxID=27933 RepID=UPI0031F6CB73
MAVDAHALLRCTCSSPVTRRYRHCPSQIRPFVMNCWTMLLLLVVAASSSTGTGEYFDRCMPNEVSYCSETLWYNFTVSHPEQQIYVSGFMNHFEPIIASRVCHRHLFRFLCFSLAPMCLPGEGDMPLMEKVVLPCRRLCEAVHSDCSPKMDLLFGVQWPGFLKCSDLPEKNCYEFYGDSDAVTGYDVIPFRRIGGSDEKLSGRTQQKHTSKSAPQPDKSVCPKSMSTDNSSTFFNVANISHCGIPCKGSIAQELSSPIALTVIRLLLSLTTFGATMVAVCFYFTHRRRLFELLDKPVVLLTMSMAVLSMVLFLTRIITMMDGKGVFCSRHHGMVHQPSSALKDGTCVGVFLSTHFMCTVSALWGLVFACLVFLKHAMLYTDASINQSYCFTYLTAVAVFMAMVFTSAVAIVGSIEGSSITQLCQVQRSFSVSQFILPLAGIYLLTLIITILAAIIRYNQQRQPKGGLSFTVPLVKRPRHSARVHDDPVSSNEEESWMVSVVFISALLTFGGVLIGAVGVNQAPNTVDHWEKTILACQQQPRSLACTQGSHPSMALIVLEELARLLPGFLCAAWLYIRQKRVKNTRTSRRPLETAI